MFEVCAFYTLQAYLDGDDAECYDYFDTLDEAKTAAQRYAGELSADFTKHRFEVVMTFPLKGERYDYANPVEDCTHTNSYAIKKIELLAIARTA